jgi:CTP:phosphocholine cytidylyltransferase-like protein
MRNIIKEIVRKMSLMDCYGLISLRKNIAYIPTHLVHITITSGYLVLAFGYIANKKLHIPLLGTFNDITMRFPVAIMIQNSRDYVFHRD